MNATRIAAAILTLVTGIAACAARAEIVVTDDEGSVVRLSQPARRIVSLAPHTTELLYAAGAGGMIVGAAEYSNFPPAARSLPQTGSSVAIDLERVVSLRPDLVIAWGSGNPRGQLDNLKRMGLAVFVSEPQRLQDVPANLRRLGRLAATGATAEAAAVDFERRLAALRERYANRPSVDVFYQVWNQPVMTIGGNQIISDVIALCGGHNLFASLPQLSLSLSREAVLKADPQVIIASGMAESRPEWLDEWRAWPQLRAVRTDNLFFIPPDLIQRPTPRVIEGAQLMCADLDTARTRQAKK